MSIFKKVDFYKDLIQIGVGRGIDVTENIHLAISDFVIGRTATGGTAADNAQAFRVEHNRHVTDSYQLARNINRQVGGAMTELLGSLENSKPVAGMLDELYGKKKP